MMVIRLAIKDILKERIQFICIISLIMGVSTPILLLLSIKVGIMNTLVGELRDDPGMKRLSIVGNHSFVPETLDLLQTWPEIGFVAPQARSIARRVEVRKPAGGRFVRVALVPTAPGDPLLPVGVVLGPDEVAVSARLARDLSLEAGMDLEAFARRGTPVTARIKIGLRVAHVLPAGALDGLGALMNAGEIERVEAFYDGYAFPDLGAADGPDPATRPLRFESFRIFARDIADVASLEALLETELRTEVRSRAGEIGRIIGLDRNLGRALTVLFVVALAGLAAALAALFWSTVQRKRTSLSLLSLMGLGTAELAAIPVIQALIYAVFGSALTCLLFVAGAVGINSMFAGRLPEGAEVAVLQPSHFVLVTLVICVISTASSAVAARIAATADPAIIIRAGES